MIRTNCTLDDRPLHLVRTKRVVASKLPVFVLCPLRYYFETEGGGVARIAAGIPALRGTAVHKAIEHFAGRPMPKGRDVREVFCNALAELLRSSGPSSLVRLAWLRYGMDGILGEEQILTASQFVRAVVAKRHASHFVAQGLGTTGPSLARGRLGSERMFESTRLDMVGRIDFAYTDSAGVVHIADFKTGKVLDENEQPKEAFLLQVAAYGMLVEEAVSTTDVVLELIGPTSRWTGGFEQGLRSRVATLLGSIQLALPKGIAVDAEALKRPGLHCQECASRAGCAHYLDALLDRNVIRPEVSPYDVAGTLVELRLEGSYAALRIRTSRDTTVSITGFPIELHPDIRPGCEIKAFGLGSHESSIRVNYPANFFVFRPDNPRLSAFRSHIRVSEPFP